MWLYVLIVSFVCVAGALVRVRSGYGTIYIYIYIYIIVLLFQIVCVENISIRNY